MIDAVPQYERLAPQFRYLHAQGKSLSEIAAIHGMDPAKAWVIRKFAVDNKRPQSVVRDRSAKPKSQAVYKQIAERVVELREVKNQTFVQLARQNKWSEAIVQRAFGYLRPKVGRKKKDGDK